MVHVATYRDRKKCRGLRKGKKKEDVVTQKKMSKSKCVNGGGVDDNSKPIYNVDILVQILSRLPVKSLMQLKSACKNWKYLIEKDSSLIDLQLTQSKNRIGFLVIVPLTEGWSRVDPKLSLRRSCKECFMTVKLIEGRYRTRANIYSVRKSSSLFYDEVLPLVNGLICFIHSEAFSVRVYNVSTRQISPWIQSTLVIQLHEEELQVEEQNEVREEEKGEEEQEDEHDEKELKQEHKEVNEEEEDEEVKKQRKLFVFKAFNAMRPTYHFGFDPATKKHKVLSIWRVNGSHTLPGLKFKNQYNLVCEILTIGDDKSWRRIAEVPPYEVKGESVYVNGSLYWNNKHMPSEWGTGYSSHASKKYERNQNDDPEVLVVFDVGDEKFRVIPIPEFILTCQPHIVGRFGPFEIAGLVEVDGHIALSYRMNDHIVKFWVLKDEFKNNENRNWIEETILLPFSWGMNQILYFRGVAGTDKMMLEYFSDPSRHMKYVSVYTYSWKHKMFHKVKMKQIGCIKSSARSLFTPFAESIFPV